MCGIIVDCDWKNGPVLHSQFSHGDAIPCIPSSAFLCSGFFPCCNENNYGWKHFADDEVVRGSIWNIWFQLCLSSILVSRLSRRSWGNSLGAELCLYMRHEAVPTCVCQTRCSELPVLTFGCPRQPRKGFANQPHSVFCAPGLNCSALKDWQRSGLISLSSHLTVLRPSGLCRREGAACVQLPNLPMHLVESTGNFINQISFSSAPTMAELVHRAGQKSIL